MTRYQKLSQLAKVATVILLAIIFLRGCEMLSESLLYEKADWLVTYQGWSRPDALEAVGLPRDWDK